MFPDEKMLSVGGHSEDHACRELGLLHSGPILVLRNWVTLSRTLIPGDTVSSMPSDGKKG